MAQSDRKRKIFTANQRRKILDLYGYTCYLCYKPINPHDLWHIDHIHPFSRGGCDCMENLRPTHPKCNERKTDRVLKGARLPCACAVVEKPKSPKRAVKKPTPALIVPEGFVAAGWTRDGWLMKIKGVRR